MGLLTEYQRRTSVQRMVELCGADNAGGLKQATLAGTVALAVGSAAVVGAGTAFTSTLQVNSVVTFATLPNTGFVVLSITDDTHLTLAWAFTGATTASTNIILQGIDLTKLQAAVQDAQQRFTEATAVAFDDTTAPGPPPAGNKCYFVGIRLVTAILYDYRGYPFPDAEGQQAWAVAQKELDRWMTNYGAGAWAPPTSDSNLTPSVSPQARPQFDDTRLTQITPFSPGGPGSGGSPNDWSG